MATPAVARPSTPTSPPPISPSDLANPPPPTLSLAVDAKHASTPSPFPSPSSSFVPPPVPATHEYAAPSLTMNRSFVASKNGRGRKSPNGSIEEVDRDKEATKAAGKQKEGVHLNIAVPTIGAIIAPTPTTAALGMMSTATTKPQEESQAQESLAETLQASLETNHQDAESTANPKPLDATSTTTSPSPLQTTSAQTTPQRPTTPNRTLSTSSLSSTTSTASGSSTPHRLSLSLSSSRPAPASPSAPPSRRQSLSARSATSSNGAGSGSKRDSKRSSQLSQIQPSINLKRLSNLSTSSKGGDFNKENVDMGSTPNSRHESSQSLSPSLSPSLSLSRSSTRGKSSRVSSSGRRTPTPSSSRRTSQLPSSHSPQASSCCPPKGTIQIRDFAYAPADPRHTGMGPDTPKLIKRLLKKWGLSATTKRGSKLIQATEDDDSTETETDSRRSSGFFGLGFGGFGGGGGGSGLGNAGGLGRGWDAFKWARGWGFGGGLRARNSGLDQSGYTPNQADFERNFDDEGSGLHDSDVKTSADAEDETENDADAEYYDSSTDDPSEEAPLLSGVYVAVYDFDPEGTAEMALVEGQEVRVVGRGGGVGWAVVLRGGVDAEVDPDRGEDQYALVPESYLTLVKPDPDVEDDEGEIMDDGV